MCCVPISLSVNRETGWVLATLSSFGFIRHFSMCSNTPFANRTGTNVTFPIHLSLPKFCGEAEWQDRQRYTLPASLVVAQGLVALSLSPPTLSWALRPLASSITSLPFPGYIFASGVDYAAHISTSLPVFLLKRIKDPEGKWYAGFPAEPQMCLLGASLMGPAGAPDAQYRDSHYWCSEKGSERILVGKLRFAGKLLLISSWKQ